MLTFSFFNALWISFFICAISSFFIFFAKRFQTLINGTFAFLTGVCLQLIATDMFSNGTDGKLIAVGFLLIFVFEFLFFEKTDCILKTKKPSTFFFPLPFLAFITLGLALDLLTLLLGLMLFGLAFVTLAKTKGRACIQDSFLKINVGLLGFAYGTAILFSRENTIAFAPLRLKLSLGNWDNWTTLGVGLLFVGVLVLIWAIIPLLTKGKK